MRVGVRQKRAKVNIIIIITTNIITIIIAMITIASTIMIIKVTDRTTKLLLAVLIFFVFAELPQVLSCLTIRF